MKDLEKLEEVYGAVQTLITPSGFNVTIREQNGEDDDILSKPKDALDGTSIVKFVSGIVVDTDITDNGKMPLDVARALKPCDKYFIVIASRIFSIGQMVKFSYQWEGDTEPIEYEEDLGLYIWPHIGGEKFPIIGDEDYFKFRIAPHPHGKLMSREITLASQKVIRYKFMNGGGEKYLMNLQEGQYSVNAEIMARGLELKIGETFQKVQSFKSFTTTDMREIRNDISKNDPEVVLISELGHPSDPNKLINYPIIASNDFFFPREI